MECLNFDKGFFGINKTYITLIPKVKRARKAKDFRPISLYNILYKLMAKVIANRIKGILPDIVDKAQSAFVGGRLITNNIIIAFEAFHWLGRARESEEKLMVIKLDVSKTFDRVE